MALPNITLTAGMRQSLFDSQQTAKMMDMTASRLSSGLKVQTALDDPINFFAAQGHRQRAGDLAQRKDEMGEAIQTVIRAEVTAGRSTIKDPYAALKELTRGRRIGQAELVEFVQGLEIGEAAKQRLLALTPATYVGDAARLLDYLQR